MHESDRPVPKIGENTWSCVLPPGLLNAGTYFLAPRIGIDKRYWIVHEEPVIKFEVHLDHGESSFWDALTTGGRPGYIAPILRWEKIQ